VYRGRERSSGRGKNVNGRGKESSNDRGLMVMA